MIRNSSAASLRLTSDLTYHVEFAGQQSDTYHVKVFDYPELVRADAELEFPEYTSLKPKVVEDVRHVTAVEGTKLTLECRLNKEVAEATLVEADGQKIALNQTRKTTSSIAQRGRSPSRSGSNCSFVDREKRANKLPAEIVVNVTPNRAAEDRAGAAGARCRSLAARRAAAKGR